MIKITLHSEIMDGNESITIYESSETSDRVLEVGVYAGAAITICLGSIAITGLIIKGVFRELPNQTFSCFGVKIIRYMNYNFWCF